MKIIIKKSKTLFGSLALAIVMIVSSCTKIEENTLTPNSKPSSAKIVAVKYDYEKFLTLTNYIHWYEGDVPKNYCVALSTKGCAPTAYIMARRLVDKKFAVDVNEYKKAIDGMSTSCTTGTGFDKISTYAQKTDQFGSKHNSYYSFNREDFKVALKGLLTKEYPSIVAVWVKGTSITDVTKDKNGKVSGEGHVVTVYGLQQTKDGTGSIIYYLDPLASASNGKKSMDYSAFLNSMGTFGSYYTQPIGVVSK